MRTIIISNYALIREGLCSIISRYDNVNIDAVAEKMSQVIGSVRTNDIDIIFLDLHIYNSTELDIIKELKQQGIRTKVVIIDFNNSKELFVKAIKIGVEGYILGKSSESEILHIVGQINKGKKYYDAFFIDSMINEEKLETDDLEQLTIREKEILGEIGKGMTNRRISERLHISENTVKKHIYHIFEKLNIKDRTQAALFANNCGIVDKSAC
ncbi:LuxR C-terminal-related transcriptional regulator [Clostridium oryzae]|uniref:Stage 0 sporulation protein A homolog n=1 Tax=Clostridium oryzae TaxID=1450648 RepID=A0A1V4IRP7_9CLOT|nr:response regulator transcription factor [Clostridium oryzae]OPJ62692.1 response regulator protein VraR [Clostridium oryzae]